MKKIILAIAALVSSIPSFASWQGKLDLSPVVSPLVMRELHDGQWLAGVEKNNIWHLDQNGTERFHAGIFQAWNAENGNAATGLVAGVTIPAQVGELLGYVVNSMNLTSTAKFLSVLQSAISIDFNGGYRPQHTPDVHGNIIYGVSASLNIGFGASDLKRGL